MTIDDLAPSPAERPELEAEAFRGLKAETRERVRAVGSVLWAQAALVDRLDRVPAGHLDAMGGAGLYGAFAPEPDGGLGLQYPELCAVVEELASSCVATTFLWAQHLRLLGAVADPAAPAGLLNDLRQGVIKGSIKGGVALTGLMPGPPRLSASPAADGWALQGEAPWVSGWGIVDYLVVVARGPDETAVTLLVDAHPQPGLEAAPARLSALNATATVRLRFSGLVVEGGRLLAQEELGAVRERSERLRLNGSFALGLAKRCCLLMGPSPLDSELLRCREQLDQAGEQDMPAARAAASELAVRSAHTLAVTRGSPSALAGDVAERLSREAAVLLVFGTRPGIKAGLLERFGATRD